MLKIKSQSIMKRLSRPATTIVWLFWIATCAIACGSLWKNTSGDPVKVLVVSDEGRCLQVEEGPGAGQYLCGREWMAKERDQMQQLIDAITWYKARMQVYEQRCPALVEK